MELWCNYSSVFFILRSVKLYENQNMRTAVIQIKLLPVFKGLLFSNLSSIIISERIANHFNILLAQPLLPSY
jgi:hypothetical protein